MGLLNPPHYYNEGVLGYPVSEHWLGLPAEMTADQVALFTGHCPPVRLGRLSRGLADRRTLRGARVHYLDQDWLLVEADLLRGRTATCWPSIRTDLRNAGATVVDEMAVVDGNIVTSRKPEDVEEFTRAVIDLVENQPEVTEIKHPSELPA